jgi:CubicO group peptidase (beta-lactamase class C family)
MMIASSERQVVRAAAGPRSFPHARGVALALLTAAVLGGASLPTIARAEEAAKSAAAMEARVTALIPALEAYIRSGMKAYAAPGLAIGIVAGDRLVYGKGFGVPSKAGGAPVDTRTVFQIGSLTKGFLATTMAIAVDRGKLHWDDRVVDLYPGFELKDPWVTREFRAFDLIAQRSGLPSYANDLLRRLDYPEPAVIRSLRHVEPVSSFRTTFAYTNITHLLTGRIVSNLAAAPDWNAVARRELVEPLGMAETSFTADAIEAAADHAQGHRWTPEGTIEVPFEPLFPYGFGAAGDMNSTIEDMARWIRLQLGNGSFERRRIVSAESLAHTRLPKVAIDDRTSYAMGWFVTRTPNGTMVWHNGDTLSFGTFLGLLPDRDVGLIVLSSEANVGLPDAIGAWALDRLMDNPEVDYVADTLKRAKAKFADDDKRFAQPASPRPFPALAPLAGSFTGPAFGKGVLRVEGDALVLALQETGAEFALTPWDGDVFTLRVLPRGRFAPMVAGMGEQPSGFAQFAAGKDGTLDVLRLTLDDGQAFEFHRD